MKAVKSIAELYREVKDYDLVLTNDAPLATALNGLLDRPHLGSWALTPQQLARRESIQSIADHVWDDLKLLTHISTQTGYDIRHVHGEVENLRRMRKHTSRMSEFLKTSSAKKIWEEYSKLPTLEKAMTNFDSSIFGSKRVAVIGLENFNDLDKYVLPSPDRLKEIELFQLDDFRIPQFYNLGNDREMARHVVDLIDESNMNDVAIVMNVTEPIADAVRSALYRKGIPFKNNMELRDLLPVRDFMDFLEMALSHHRLKVKEARPLLKSQGHYIAGTYDNHRFRDRVVSENEPLRELADIMSKIQNQTFGSFLELVVNDKKPSPLPAFLKKLGLWDRNITRENLDILRYAVECIDAGEMDIEIPFDEQNGVVLIDCLNSSYVDRSLIFFLGLGNDWSPRVQGSEYIDSEREMEKEVVRFQTLIQQGAQRGYMINSSRKGKDVTPCLMFTRVKGQGGVVKSFDDISEKGCINLHWMNDRTPHRLSPVSSANNAEPELFSSSSLSQYVQCPKSYLFYKRIKGVEEGASLFGTLLHNFAQFYISYPELVKETGLEEYLDIFMAQYSPLREPVMATVDRSRASIGMRSLIKFIDDLNPFEYPLIPWDETLVTESDDDSDEDDCPQMATARIGNPFFRHHGLNKKRANTEKNLIASSIPFRGRLDLEISKGKGLDFKSGRKVNLKQMMKNSIDDCPEQYFSLQPLAYVFLMSDEFSEERIRLQFYYPMASPLNDVFPESAGVEKNNLISLSYRGQDRWSFVREGNLMRLIQEQGPKYAHKIINGRYAEFQTILLDAKIPDRQGDWENDGILQARFQESFKENKGKELFKTVKLCREMLDGKNRILDGEYILLKEDIKAFQSLAQESSILAAKQRTEGFPATPRNPNYCQRGKCPFFAFCTDGGNL